MSLFTRCSFAMDPLERVFWKESFSLCNHDSGGEERDSRYGSKDRWRDFTMAKIGVCNFEIQISSARVDSPWPKRASHSLLTIVMRCMCDVPDLHDDVSGDVLEDVLDNVSDTSPNANKLEATFFAEFFKSAVQIPHQILLTKAYSRS